jgi:hypothetical protein
MPVAVQDQNPSTDASNEKFESPRQAGVLDKAPKKLKNPARFR